MQKQIQEILFLPVRTGSLDNEFIKRALQKYGAVYSTMYWDLTYYQEEYHTYQCTRSLPANHAITIVGWNDSFDRNKFTHVPPGDRAFIVKNSWGGAWGRKDTSIFLTMTSSSDTTKMPCSQLKRRIITITSTSMTPLGWIISKEFPGNLIAWGGNVFSSERNETLRAVGFYTTDLNTAYEICIYKNPVSGPINSRRVFVAKESGTYSLPGYHTHTLNSTVNLNPGEKFSVVIRFRNPSAGGSLAVEQPISFYSSKAQTNPRESYVSQDGARWDDISEASEANLCIKAFTTTNELPEANFSSNVTGGNYPLTVQFNDLSKNSFSWEWDLNGDGIVDSTARNPIYTYDSYGIYTVSLKVSNRNGFDSKTKNNYVTTVSFSIDSANPEGSITTYQGDIQEFNNSINRTCDISWYLNGEFKGSQSSVQSSSYSDAILSPGFYNITALAESGGEKLMYSWNWTVRDWNSWDNSTSREGENISTVELQQAIHIYHNGLKIPGTGAELTSERLKELIRLWRENPFD